MNKEIEIAKYLADISGAIENISLHLNNKLDFDSYCRNITVKRAVERELEIIGEADGRVYKIDDNFPLSYGKTIVAMRNRIIHGYDSVDENLIWKVIVKDVPILKNEVETLLKDIKY